MVVSKPWQADYEFQISGIALNHDGAAMWQRKRNKLRPIGHLMRVSFRWSEDKSQVILTSPGAGV